MAAADALLGPADIRLLARSVGLVPAKSRGQNFVHDANSIRRIVRIAGLRGDDVVLEIGPGLGSLTLALLPAAAAVVAVEIDTVLAALLPDTVAGRLPEHAGKLSVISADAMDPPPLPGAPPSVLVANLPYNVAVLALLRALQRWPSVRSGLVLVQAEVADRLVAVPGSRAYGVPSVKLAWFAAARRAGAVARTVFWPEPHVDSGLVAFTARPAPDGADRAATFAVVDAAFAQRRKTLRSALAGWAGSADAAGRLLASAGIDPGARAESLHVRDFARLAGAGG